MFGFLKKFWPKKKNVQGYEAFSQLLTLLAPLSSFRSSEQQYKKITDFIQSQQWDSKTSTMFLLGLLFDSQRLSEERLFSIIKSLDFDVTLPLQKINDEMYSATTHRVSPRRTRFGAVESSYVYSVWDHLAISHDENLLLVLAETIKDKGLSKPYSSSIFYRPSPVSENTAYLVLKRLELLPLDIDCDVPCLHLSAPVHSLREVLSHCQGSDVWKKALQRRQSEKERGEFMQHILQEKEENIPIKKRKI